MNVGQASVIVPPAPEQNAEVQGLLRLAADPKLAEKLIAFYAAWDEAHKANKEILKNISRGRSLEKLEEKVAGDQAKANRAISDAERHAKHIENDAQAKAQAILDAVADADSGLHDRELAVTATQKSLDVREDAVAKQEKSLTKRETTLTTGREQLNADKKALAEKVASVKSAWGSN